MRRTNKNTSKNWPKPLQTAVYKRRDESRSFTPPSPHPEMIPETPPRVEKTKKTHSPVTYISQDEAPRIPIRDRLGDRPATPNTNDPQEETPRRSIRDRLGGKPATSSRPVRERLENVYLRRSKRRSKRYVAPFQQGCAPPKGVGIRQKNLGLRPRRKIHVPSPG